MSRIHAQLKEIERLEKKRMAKARRHQRIAQKSLSIIQKRADPTVVARRLLGVERRQARTRAMIWIVLSIIILALAVNYLYHTISRWWPAESPLFINGR